MFLTNNSPPVDRGIPPDANGLKGVDGLRLWLPIIFGVTAYLNLLTSTGRLLIDSDVYWHIAVGQWIVDHRAVPHVDPFSFTMRGAPWITSEWLSEVLYFAAFKAAGWAGPVILAASSIAAAFFLLTRLLLRTIADHSGDDSGGGRNGNHGASYACTATCAGVSGVGSVG